MLAFSVGIGWASSATAQTPNNSWTGNAGVSDWGNGANWTASVPAPPDDHIGFNGTANPSQPVLDTNRTVASMLMNGNNNLNLNFQTLTITGLAAQSAGTVSGTGTLAVTSYNFTGGTIANTVTFDTGGSAANLVTLNGVNFGGIIIGSGGLQTDGSVVLGGGTSTYTGGSTINTGSLTLAANNALSTGSVLTVNGGASLGLNGFSQTVAGLNGSGTVDLGNNGLTVNGGGSFSGAITSAAGDLIKTGAGTLTLSGTSTYGAGTFLNAGTIAVGSNGALGTGTLNMAAGTTLQAAASVSLANAIALTGSDTVDTNGNALTLSGAITGGGQLTKIGAGTLTLSGTSTYAGATSINAGTLVLSGTVASATTVAPGATITGAGTVGGLTVNGTIAPGNGIGTLNVGAGGYTQNAGSTYTVDVNPAGQSDRIAVTGTATINGGTVAVQAAGGTYQRNTIYTILSATGGRTGTYSGVTSNLAFLTPTLGYDANNVTLALINTGNSFQRGAHTPNQQAVGVVLDQASANATGDFATVIDALFNLDTVEGPRALQAISGQPYAGFGTFNIANNALFMNAVFQQIALARGGLGSGQRQALLADACDAAACDGARPFSAWVSALGGLGSVKGDGNNSQAFAYNMGGTAAGIDYRLSPSLLLGVSAAYTSGTQWVDGFQGKGWSDSVSVAAYGSFTQGGLYVDALAGYAYSNNRMQRQISIPGLAQRTANGSTGANQFLAQLEAGYAFAIHAPTAAKLTPFARFQASSIDQAAFNEWGADSLNLNVQRQTTSSLRTTLGAELAGTVGLGEAHTVDLGLRLGWLHEYAGTARPLTAAFAGAPAANFTVFGATPQRDAAVIGFQASSRIAAGTQLYLRYDGDIGSGTDNHAVNLGVRISW